MKATVYHHNDSFAQNFTLSKDDRSSNEVLSTYFRARDLNVADKEINRLVRYQICGGGSSGSQY
jgi:hypothetical protein